ncbi:MAG TPA: hypothetical protein VKQ72_13595 [Aggregatilineales bacterium]|nr:hypothetical protein [Aggregatilineales bacterium]
MNPQAIYIVLAVTFVLFSSGLLLGKRIKKSAPQPVRLEVVDPRRRQKPQR